MKAWLVDLRETLRLGERHASVNLGVARIWIWADGGRRWGVVLDGSDFRNGWEVPE